MQPRSASYSARNVIGPEYNLTYWRFIQQDPGQAWWSAFSAKTTAEAGTLATAVASTRLASTTFVAAQRLLTDVLVAPAPLDGLAAPSYVAQLQSLTWQALRDVPMPGSRCLSVPISPACRLAPVSGHRFRVARTGEVPAVSAQRADRGGASRIVCRPATPDAMGHPGPPTRG